MKYETDKSRTVMNTSISRCREFYLLLSIIASILATTVNVTAAVHVVRFDPPLTVNAFAEAPDGVLPNILAVDFNVNDDVDFRLAYGYGFIAAYFNHPTRFGRREGRPGVEPVGGPVAAVPLCSIIGSEILSSVNTNRFVWSPGYTNRDDLTQPLGNHEAGVVSAGFTTYGLLCQIILSSNGVLVTNCFGGGPVASGDIVGKEAVMALEFYINGQRHYGYIHFDFRPLTDAPLSGTVGVIHGWAYETEPGILIQAVPLSPVGKGNKHKPPCGTDD